MGRLNQFLNQMQQDEESQGGPQLAYSPEDMAAMTDADPVAVQPSPLDRKPAMEEADEGGADAAAAPQAPASPGMDMSKYMVSPEELQKLAGDKKRNALIGGMTDALSNGQSFGNYFLGHMNPHNDSSKTVAALNDAAEAPVANKQVLLKQEMQKPELAYMQQSLDPKSPLSSALRDQMKAAISSLSHLDYFKKNPDQLTAMAGNLDGMNGMQLQKMASSLEPLKLAQSGELAQAKLDMAKAMNDFRITNADRNYGAKVDNMAAGASKGLDSHPIMQKLTKQLQQIQLDSHTLADPNTKLTPSMLSEIEQGVANALGGGAAGFHAAEKQEMATAMRDSAKLKQYITANPQEAASPQIKQQYLSILARLQGGYKKAQGTFATEYAKGKNYSHTPEAQRAMQETVGKYQQEKQSVTKDQLDAYATQHKMDREAAAKFLEGQGYGVER